MDGNHSIQPLNDSIPELFEMTFVVSQHLPFVFISILIVLMNTLVLLLFAFNKNLRKPYNFLLMSLSVSDLLTGFVGLPLLLVCSTRPFCLPCVFSVSFMMFTSISTVLHILVVSYERYVKIAFPFRMQQIGRASFEIRLIVCLWFISSIIPPIQYIWLPPTEESCYAPMTDEILLKEKVFTISTMVLFVGLPVLLLIYADVSVFFVVRRQLAEIDKTSVGLRDSQQRLKKETRVLALFAFMMLYFVISWSFYYVSMIMHSIVGGEEIYMPDWLLLLTEILRVSTPLVNPILYVLMKHDFRRVVFTGVRHFVRNYTGKRNDGSAQDSNGAATICPSDSRNVTERTVFL